MISRRTLLKSMVVIPAALSLSSVPTFGYDKWPRIKVTLKEDGITIGTWYRDIPTCGTFSTVEIQLTSLEVSRIRRWDHLSIQLGATAPCQISALSLSTPAKVTT